MLSCPACSNTLSVESYEPDLKRCPACDHVWQYPAIVTAQYDAKYVHQRYDAYPTTEIMSYLRLGLMKCFVSPLCGRDFILDVGYGNGSFLKACKKAGYKCYGSDVHGVDYGIEERPLDGSETYDCVTFFDSLEHFADFEAIRKVLNRSHYVIVSIPFRPANFPQNLNWKHYRPGEHLHYPSLNSLKHILKKRLVFSDDLEDAIRGKNKDGSQNILTAVFA